MTLLGTEQHVMELDKRIQALEGVGTGNKQNAQQGASGTKLIPIMRFGIGATDLKAGVPCYRNTASGRFNQITNQINLGQYAGVTIRASSKGESISLMWIGELRIGSGNFVGHKELYINPKGRFDQKSSNDTICVGTAKTSKDVILTGATGVTPIDASSISTSTLKLWDTNKTHRLSVTWNEDDTANRALTLRVNKGNRDLYLQGNLNVEDNSNINQDVTTDASPSWIDIGLSGNINATGGLGLNAPSGSITLDASQNVNVDGASTVRLKYNGNTKLEVNSSGVKLASTLDMDGQSITMGGGLLDGEGGAITTTGDIYTTGAGNLGRGRVPTAELDVYDSANNLDVILQTDKVNGTVSVNLRNDVGNWFFGVNTADHFVVSDILTSTTPFLIEKGCATNAFYINSANAEVGLGTNNPAHKIHAYATSGSIAMMVESTAANSAQSIRWKNDAQEWRSYVHGGLADKWYLYDATNTKTVIEFAAGGGGACTFGGSVDLNGNNLTMGGGDIDCEGGDLQEVTLIGAVGGDDDLITLAADSMTIAGILSVPASPAGASPVATFTNNGGSGNWYGVVDYEVPALATGKYAFFNFGKNSSNYNRAYMAFYYGADQTSTNHVELALTGSTKPLKVYGTGNVDINGVLDMGGYNLTMGGGTIDCETGFIDNIGYALVEDGGYIGSGSTPTDAFIRFDVTNQQLEFNASAIGLGTQAPVRKMHVEGSGDTRIALTNGAASTSDLAFEWSHAAPNAAGADVWGLGLDHSNAQALTFAWSTNGNVSLTGNQLWYMTTAGILTCGSGSLDLNANNLTMGGGDIDLEGGELQTVSVIDNNGSPVAMGDVLDLDGNNLTMGAGTVYMESGTFYLDGGATLLANDTARPYISLLRSNATDANLTPYIEIGHEAGDVGTFTTVHNAAGKLTEVTFNSLSGGGVSAAGFGDFVFEPDNVEVLRIQANKTVKNSGGVIHNTTRITSNTTLDASHHTVFCPTNGGAFTITLPPLVDGTEYVIINTGSIGRDVTVAPDGTDDLFGVNSSDTVSDGEVLVIRAETTEGWW